uniref:calcium-binding and spermatid-specific protein 1 n=1 Tax=Jaculus jaculus TaxID=51337 RepID=UPI001E1B3F97|nr:calcium-binding and spermatid-specific protein 1 [Jaculus jaculus]
MAEDGSPKIYSHPPRESSKTPTDSTVFPRPEPTITSEGDHVTPVTEHTLEGDFSTTANKLPTTQDKLKREDDVETHKSTLPEKGSITPTETTNSTASEIVSESFIPVKIGSISTPVGTVSLIDFPSTLAKEDVLLASSGIGGKDSSLTAELSSPLENSKGSVEDTSALQTEKPETDVTIYTSSIKSDVPGDEAARVTKSLIPEAEISPSTDKDFADNPDTTNLAKEKVTEIVSEDDPTVVSKLTDNDEEKFITVFELTNSMEKDKGDSEESLTDDESPDGTNAWMERETTNEAETHSVLLTAVESRYDFIAPARGMKNFKGDPAASIAVGSSENATTPSVIKIIEPLSADAPALDTPDNKEDSSSPETGVFKLLKEDPDEFMI